MRVFMVLAALALTTACDPVHTTAVVTKSAEPWHGTVRLVRTPPAEHEQLAVVEAEGIDQSVHEVTLGFAEKVASVGGTVGVIDSVQTKRVAYLRMNNRAYPCTYAMCPGSRLYAREENVTIITGRAFRK